jgi:hypothetical protein
MQYNSLVVNLFILLLTPSISMAFDDSSGFYQFSTPIQSEDDSYQQQPDQAASDIEEVTTSSSEEPPIAKPTPQPLPVKQNTTAQYSLRSLGFKANGEPMSHLNSCGKIRMVLGQKRGRQNPSCDPVKIANTFAPMLMKNLPICIAEAVKASGINKTIATTNIFNADSYRDRRAINNGRFTNKWSMHSTGRAFDIYQIDVNFTDGSKLETPMTVNSRNRPFYRNFNNCWRQLNNGCDGSLRGLIDCKDSDHRDHVHLSMPFCPRRAGYSST